LECALPLGCLRWLSLREDWGLKFEGLDFEKFIEKETLAIDIMKMIRYVRSYTASKSQAPRLNLADGAVLAKIQQVLKEEHDPWHICCGHDVVTLLTLGLRKVLGTSKNAELEHIATGLWLAYEHTSFAKTQLYAALRAWEQRNVPFTILDGEFLVQ
jgi:hypothetical protein